MRETLFIKLIIDNDFYKKFKIILLLLAIVEWLRMSWKESEIKMKETLSIKWMVKKVSSNNKNFRIIWLLVFIFHFSIMAAKWQLQ